ncbi:ectonucleoside triphosphate diphosphohydrolase 8-like isoform X1 [Pelodiscus sinensis]|uniref:ectonucleoside triphosphate diphosphohydrolase 8-like isoform X1 n=1 Tax=Pelodiscus sinensis TaxID=13735 RepID=UPI003F6B4DD7
MSASPQVGAAMCQPLAGRAVRWLLAVAAGSGVATLVLILVQVKDVPLPPRTKLSRASRVSSPPSSSPGSMTLPSSLFHPCFSKTLAQLPRPDFPASGSREEAAVRAGVGRRLLAHGSLRLPVAGRQGERHRHRQPGRGLHRTRPRDLQLRRRPCWGWGQPEGLSGHSHDAHPRQATARNARLPRRHRGHAAAEGAEQHEGRPGLCRGLQDHPAVPGGFPGCSDPHWERGRVLWLDHDQLPAGETRQGAWTHPEAAAVVGALDLGGASTQITFHPGRAVEDNSTQALFRLYGASYSLYTHSYLCYGASQALRRLLAVLREENPSLQLSHPCYPRGYEENVTAAALYASPCVPAPAAQDPQQVLTVRGTGAPAECRRAVRKLFNFTACGANRTCGFNGVYQPPAHGQFFAFSGFYSVFHFLNLTSGQPLSDVQATVERFCAKEWREVQAMRPALNKTRLQDYCGASTYILTLLLQGYKFSNQTWSNIQFRQQVAAVDVGWSLGYMLNLTNAVPTEAPERVKGQRPALWAAAVLTACLTLALLLWSSLALCYQRRFATYETML